jgi:hypothetical protein
LREEALMSTFAGTVEHQMLDAAESAMRPVVPAGTRMVLQQSAAEEFTPPGGWRADLVTICRAFHWLDQAPVLARLADQVAIDAAVAIFGDNSFWAAGSPWKDAVRTVIRRVHPRQRVIEQPGAVSAGQRRATRVGMVNPSLPGRS